MTSVLFGSYDGPTPPPQGCGSKGRAGSMEAANAGNGRHAAHDGGIHADTQAGTDGLSERDLKILEFERQWWKYAGAKEQAMREKFDMSATRYYPVSYTHLTL